MRENFWRTLGQYLAPHLSAEGLRINWINYKTGIKHLHFKMEVTQRTATIAILISHPDKDIRELMMAQFKELQHLLANAVQEQWTWVNEYPDETGKINSRIFISISDVSVFRQEDWPKLISFFKPRMIALDEFWSQAQYGFDLFR